MPVEIPKDKWPGAVRVVTLGNTAQDKHAATATREMKTKSESAQALEQWLRRIPDDPGGLLRRKFMMQHQQREQADNNRI